MHYLPDMNPVNVLMIKEGQLLVDKKTFIERLAEALNTAAGRNLSWPERKNVTVDFAQIKASAQKSGDYAILNCSCGHGGGCAGVNDKINVVHEGEFITWTFSSPQVEAHRAQQKLSLRFHKSQYLKELKKT